MKKIVIIGAGEFQNPLIKKAKEMGYETHVFAWECGDIGEKTADCFYPVSIIEKEQILEQCKKISPAAVVTIASDLAAVTVNYVAGALGLPCNSAECTLCATNKFRMREAFFRAGVSTPSFALIEDADKLEALQKLQFPLIIKPTDRSGSRGITKVERLSEAREAAYTAIEYSFEKKAIAEEMISGAEYSCECISQNGKHHILSFTKKETTGEPHFIETGHIEPSDILPENEQAIKDDIISALSALHITTGASHAEFRLSDAGKARIIEIGARMGGDCIGSHLVPLATGYDFMKMVVEAAAGEPLSMERAPHCNASAIRFLFAKSDVENMKTVKKRFPRVIVEKSPVKEENLLNVVDSSTRAGFYIMAGAREEIYQVMRLTGAERQE
ncbi:MAG: ATP-grasp domain-containing protein [Christensenella sp.]